ncbi:MAG: hypothetical protein ACI4ST_07860 [Candidatus Gallimonas sp.]
MNKILALSIGALFALSALCACERGGNDEPFYEGEVNELLSAEELIDFHQNGEKFPENFGFAELTGYGRVVSSASSRAEALSTVQEQFANEQCMVSENRVDLETDLYYGIYVKWLYSDGGGEPVSYDESVVSFKREVYDAETQTFGTRNREEMKKILDYLYYAETCRIGGSKIYSSELTEKEGAYEYVIYYLQVNYGDWGLRDELSFMKEVRKINLSSGGTTLSRETVGSVTVDGENT